MIAEDRDPTWVRWPVLGLAAALITVATSAGIAGPASSAELSDLEPDRQLAVESTVEGGYLARFIHQGSPFEVSATVTVPTLACDSTDAGLVTSIGVVEVPYRFAGGRVYHRCIEGAAVHEARLESSAGAGEEIDGAVEAGDRIKITAVWDGNIARPVVDVTMISRDQGWRATAQFSFIADGFNGAIFRQTPLWLGGSELPIAPYTRARVTGARVDVDRLGEVTRTRYVLVDDAGDRLVVPTKIKSGGRFAFSYVG